jgi:hypothetical protein
MATVRKTSKKSKARKTTKKAKKKSSKSKSGKAKSRKAPAKAKAKARKTPSKSTSAEPMKAMRLTFSYDGDNVKLISQQRTEMIVPPSDPVKGYRKQKGFWAELKSEQDKTLYRQVMHNPTRNDIEVFPETPDEGISREPAPKRKGIFVVLVPDTEKAEEVTLFRSVPETQGPASGLFSLASKPATEIMRFKLKK